MNGKNGMVWNGIEQNKNEIRRNLLKILSNLSFYLTKKSEMEMLPKLLFLFDSIRNKKLKKRNLEKRKKKERKKNIS